MMNNMIKNLFKLVKAGYDCKKNIRRCLKQDKNSQAYILAKHYDVHFKEIEDSDLTLEHIDTLMNEIDMQLIQNQDSDEIQQLLSNMGTFLVELKPFVKMHMA